MPTADAYIVRYLIRETNSHPRPLCWAEEDPGFFRTSLHGIDVELYRLGQHSGSRYFLTLYRSLERIDIEEPVSPDGSDLASLLRDLASAARRQTTCHQDELDPGVTIRESIYRQLLGAERVA